MHERRWADERFLSGSVIWTHTGRHSTVAEQRGRRSRLYFDQLELGSRVVRELQWSELFFRSGSPL